MNWLAKINLTTVVSRLGAFKASLLLLALVIICLYSGYRIGNFFHNYQMQTLANQKIRLDKLYEQEVEHIKRINTLEVELEVERMSSQRSRLLLKEMEEDHYQVKKQLAFYEKVMTPEKEADGLVIDDVVIFPTQSPHHYRFQLTLVQKTLRKQFAKGHVTLSIVGSSLNKPYELNLEDISTSTDKQLSFSFKYFQIIEGSLTLPTDFVPEKVKVAVILPKNKWQKYRRIDENHVWRNIIKHQE